MHKVKTKYTIMHGLKGAVASVDSAGGAEVFDRSFMPYNLWFDEEEDIDARVNNLAAFYYWCASRVLTLDRKYAKAILNSIGASQAVTDRDRAAIALSYHCLSLTDVYWVKKDDEDITFEEINLYENHFDNALVDISLRGRQMTVQNIELAKDLSTNGCFPKAWLRMENGFRLLKDGDCSAVKNEILASRICSCFDCRQVIYDEDSFDGETVSSSRIMTDLQHSIVSRENFDIYAVNHDIDPLEYILNLDPYSYYMMNMLDYLIGNTDRHRGNWGLLIDNKSNQPISLHPLMDLNQSFNEYNQLDGANCQTTLPKIMTQKEAAMEAVQKNGLNQISEINPQWFTGREAEYKMFLQRLQICSSSE